MPDPNSLMRVREDDPEYRRQAEAEAAFWDDVHPFGLETLEQMLEEGPVDLYSNERYTGDPHLHWYDVLNRFGTFRRALILGTSSLHAEAGILRGNPSLHATFADISPGAVQRREDILGPRFPGRVSTMVADMNFVEIEEGGYDLIVSCACVHHVTNLEYLADQINRGLSPGGRFVLQDYVGEPRFQFADAKKRVFEILYLRDQARHGVDRPFHWLGTDDLSPFCGISSDEVLPVMRQHLDEEVLRTAGALHVPIMRVRPAEGVPAPSAYYREPLVRRLRKKLRLPALKREQFIDPLFIDELALVGDVLVDAGIIAAGNAFAVYRKRSGAPSSGVASV